MIVLSPHTKPSRWIPIDLGSEIVDVGVIELQTRSIQMSTPSMTQERLTVHFNGDDDLIYARLWINQPIPPEDLPFTLLSSDLSLSIALEEGMNEVYGQVATREAIEEGDPLFAWTSSILSTRSLRDSLPPVVNMR